jgi:hypothetical protein
MEVSASVHEKTHPLVAHDILMNTGLYSAFQLEHGKGHVSRLVPAKDREELTRQQHDNVIYVPHELVPALPEMPQWT